MTMDKNMVQHNNSVPPIDQLNDHGAAIGITDGSVAIEDVGLPDDPVVITGADGIVDPVVPEGNGVIEDIGVQKGLETPAEPLTLRVQRRKSNASR